MKYTHNPYSLGQNGLPEEFTHLIMWEPSYDNDVKQFLNVLGFDVSKSSGREKMLKINQIPVTEKEYDLLKSSCDETSYESSYTTIKEPCLTIFKL